MSDTPVDHIAAAIVQRTDGKVLLLKRASTHTTNPGKWCFVTGYVEPGELPREAAIRELSEELGITAEPVREGRLVVVHASWGKTLHVHPYLFPVGSITVTLEREHVEFVWIEPHMIYNYDFVQQLDEDLMSLDLL